MKYRIYFTLPGEHGAMQLFQTADNIYDARDAFSRRCPSATVLKVVYTDPDGNKQIQYPKIQPNQKTK